MFFAEYSLLAMFDTYPASKCTTQNMYTRICAGLVVIVSLRTALGSLKEERKKEHGQYNTRRWIGNELIYGGILKSIRVTGIAE